MTRVPVGVRLIVTGATAQAGMTQNRLPYDELALTYRAGAVVRAIVHWLNRQLWRRLLVDYVRRFPRNPSELKLP